jgi:hypothetical protein
MIKHSFLVISQYNNDLSWISALTSNYLIYDQSEKCDYPKGIDPQKIIRSKHTGHNLSDYFSYIIDNYQNLPDIIMFTKGNVFPRHVRREYFEHIMNNNYFTPIEDAKVHNPKWPKGYISSDGGFNEINNNLFLTKQGHPFKYFNSYNDFLRFCFKYPILPPYIRFNPAAMFIIPKAHILKYPKVFYENLQEIVSYALFPAEAYIVERALYTIWAGSFVLHKNMLKPLDITMTTIKDADSIQKLQAKIPMSIKKNIPKPIRILLQSGGRILLNIFNK